MNDEPNIHIGKWYGLLIFAAGSVLTGIAARVTPYDRGNALLMMILAYWTVFGLAAGTWILRGRRWQSLPHDTRQRLGLAYLAIGWGGLFGWTLHLPVVNLVIIAPGIALAIAFAASMFERRQRRQDEGDTFP